MLREGGEPDKVRAATLHYNRACRRPLPAGLLRISLFPTRFKADRRNNVRFEALADPPHSFHACDDTDVFVAEVRCTPRTPSSIAPRMPGTLRMLRPPPSGAGARAGVRARGSTRRR